MKSFVKILIVIIATSFSLKVVAQKNISKISNLQFPGETCAGVWQYIDSLGNVYALVGSQNGLSIVDITTPSSPQLLFSIPAVPSLWREVKVWQHYAYSGTEGGGGILIVDMSGLPSSIDTISYTGDSIMSTAIQRSHTVQAVDGFLYINGCQGLGNGGTLICDLADPMHPHFIGQYQGHYVHDCFVRGDTLWVSEIFNGTFSIVNISNKNAPVAIVSTPTPSAFNHNGCLSDDSKTFFTTDEHHFAPLASFDVTDTANITLLDKYSTIHSSFGEVHNVRLLNDFLVTCSYGDTIVGQTGSQVTIVDAARPANLIETGYIEVGGAAPGLKLSWDASPFVPNDEIIATDLDSGLFVLQATYVRACYLEGTATDSSTSLPINTVNVEILSTAVADSTDPSGDYETGYADSGTYSVRFTKQGYITKVITGVHLNNGVLTVLDVQLNAVSGINEEAGRATPVIIAPNPVRTVSSIIIPPDMLKKNSHLQLSISDASGKKVYTEKEITCTEIPFSRNELPAGVYFFSLQSSGKNLYSGKIVVE